MKRRKTSEYQKRKQAKAQGLLPHTGHRSHQSGRRWIRPWEKRRHVEELKEVAKNFGGELNE